MTVTMDTPVRNLPQVGEVRAGKLAKLGIATAADLLSYYPRNYEDRTRFSTIADAPMDRRVCVMATQGAGDGVSQRPG